MKILFCLLSLLCLSGCKNYTDEMHDHFITNEKYFSEMVWYVNSHYNTREHNVHSELSFVSNNVETSESYYDEFIADFMLKNNIDHLILDRLFSCGEDDPFQQMLLHYIEYDRMHSYYYVYEFCPGSEIKSRKEKNFVITPLKERWYILMEN